LGIVHSRARQLGEVYDTPYGVANALLLPYVIEYNAKASGEKYKEIGRYMGVIISKKLIEIGVYKYYR
jgi:lactaldehyde reductase